MGLFKPDLYRSFAIGFVLGTAAMGGVLAMSAGKDLDVIPVAEAAPAHLDRTLAPADAAPAAPAAR